MRTRPARLLLYFSALALASAALRLGETRPASAQTIIEFPLPMPGSRPLGITAGPDGALWFAEHRGQKIGRTTTTGPITEFPVPNPGGAIPTPGPHGIAAGPDGALWFTEYTGDKIGRITTAGAVTEFTIPTRGSGPAHLTAGPDGAMWFTELFANKIGRITTAGTITEFPTAGRGPTDIVAGPDGAVWFTLSFSNRIGRITTAGAITEFPVPTASSGPNGIAVGPDGALWFTQYSANKIGRITTAGAITEFPIPTPNSGPGGITAGPDGALWFTEHDANKIGRITTTGVITEFSVPTPDSRPWDISAGPDGGLWFTEDSGNKIGRIGAPATAATLTPTSTNTAAIPTSAVPTTSLPTTAVPPTGVPTTTVPATATTTASATAITIADAFEPDDSPAQARPLRLDGGLQQHSLHTPGDDDWVSFSLSAGEQVRLFTGGSTCDTFLSLYAPDGRTILAEDHNSGPNRTSLISYTVSGSGTHLGRVQHFDRARGICASYGLGGIIAAMAASPTPTVVASRTPTGGPPAIGGRGVGLRFGPPALSWSPGNAQSGYFVVRFAGSGSAILPPGGIPLPAAATSFTDTQNPRDPFVCYLVVPLGPPGALGISDLLCGMPGTRSVGGSPGEFTIRLNQGSVAGFAWTASGRQDSYNLLAFPLSPGGVPRQVQLPGDTTRATEDTGGAPTCYLLQAQVTGVTIGSTDVLCAFPGVSTLGPPATETPTPSPTVTPTATSTPTPTPTATQRPLGGGSCARVTSVTIASYAYTPREICVTVGTTVGWGNSDSVAHTVTSDTGLFSSPLLPMGGVFPFTFSAPGTYTYHCVPHPWMQAVVIVL